MWFPVVILMGFMAIMYRDLGNYLANGQRALGNENHYRAWGFRVDLKGIRHRWEENLAKTR